MIVMPVRTLITQTAKMSKLLAQLVHKSILFPLPYTEILSEIEQLIQESTVNRRALLSVLDPSGTASVLHIAVLYHDVPLIQRLFVYGAKLSVRNQKSETPLHWAIKEQEEEVISMLLETAALPLELQDIKGRTPLHWAAKARDLEFMVWLLLEGADPTIEDKKGKTPVYYFDKYYWLDIAVQNKDLESVQCLLKAGVNVNQKNKNGKTALQVAIKQKSLKMITLLLEYQAEVNAAVLSKFEKYQLLHLAVGMGNLECARWLLEVGINVNAQDAQGQTPLYLAAGLENLEMVELLLAHGADLDRSTTAGVSARDLLIPQEDCSPCSLGKETESEEDELLLTPVVSVIHFTQVRATRSENIADLVSDPVPGTLVRAKTYADLRQFGVA